MTTGRTGDSDVTRSTLPIAVTVTALLGLPLSACGGGSEPADRKEPVATSTAPPPAATAEAVRRPTTELPGNLRMVFDWPKTGDAAKDAVLTDAEQYVRALKRASARHDLKDPAYRFYARNAALTYAHDQIKVNIDGGWAPVGDDRYYDVKVDLLDSGRATLGFCRDQSKVFSRDVRTGRVNRGAPNANSYVLYNLLLVHDDASNGVWQASEITVIEGVAKCRH
jgi:hypothetical protein